MINYEALYTIKPKNYEFIFDELKKKEAPSEQLLALLQEVVFEHSGLIKIRDRIIQIIEQTRDQLFSDTALKGQHTIPDLNGSSEENNLTSPDDDLNKKKPRGKKQPLTSSEIIAHTLTEEQKKCISCGNKMHMQRTKTTSVVISAPIFKTETHTAESCRCLTCDTQENAILPSYATEEEMIGRYHFSAVSSLIALRYQYGMPSYRLEQLSTNSGQRISDSTQWALFEQASARLSTFFNYLYSLAADAPINHFDDTHNIVISTVKGIEKEQELAVKKGLNLNNIRTGIHTTNMTAVYPEGKIIIYQTGLHHAGEALEQLLSKRTVKDQIILMADASTSNTSKIKGKGLNFELANCNSHALRKFKDIFNKEKLIAQKAGLYSYQGSEFITFLLDKYKIIFENDAATKNFSPQKQLEYHQKYSQPLLSDMHQRIETELLQKTIEPNSDIGKSCIYFINHFKQLSAFCRIKSAPVCNNLSERMLKSIIRQRKNSLFYKNTIGAAVGDILTSLLFTADVNGLNSIEYITNLLLYENLWKKNPKQWLPWKYKDTIAGLGNKKILSWKIVNQHRMIPTEI